MLRFATSPTEDISIDTLQIAIINYIVAQQRGESFLIRMDDLDKKKIIEGKDSEYMQILEKFALNHKSVFHQSEHLHMYQRLALKLLENDKAFVCTCIDLDTPCLEGCENVDKSENFKLKESGTPFVVRIKKPTSDLLIEDLICGDIATTAKKIDSFIILNTDGIPTDNFASACDDMLSGITTIIREYRDHLKSAKEEHVKMQLGFATKTNYAHTPNILYHDDKRSVKWMLKEGFLPDAIINYLILLSNPNAPKEVFTLPEAVEWFRLEDISVSSVTFDSSKLRLLNREHLKRMDDKTVSTLFGFADADIGKLAKLYLDEAYTTKELESKIKTIFTPKDFTGKHAEHMRTLEAVIQNAPMFLEFNDFISYIMLKSGLKNRELLEPLRVLLIGETQGPELRDIYPLIKSYLLEIAS
jgi:glutamyl-tRNA synthetase